ncbi:hypothetical protein CNMCM5793_004188 [Aspergillus hiratsukae]|uniref:F-box domain-containing protein n=1 Tax=Aspergillus hiratsukae TaxID=1194566 RepID=A0A8H6P3P3_9EURO|nr:hypothetical protein CNMCM5793_004188 [Aspergillus hiratsukae]KAF7159147.1 hypothetical protein CNMCM6106_006232 [Aspergillus hiratsukae]
MTRSLDRLPPEIWLTILEGLDMPSLARVIRVNRHFFNLGIQILWQCNSDFCLAKVLGSRLQLYTPWIQSLDLSAYPDELRQVFGDYEFPNVKELLVHMEDHDKKYVAKCRYLTHFMNPGLRVLRLRGPFTGALLRDVPNKCPELRVFIFASPGPCKAADVLACVRGLPYLESLNIGELQGHTLIDSRIIELAAKSQRIQSMSLDGITPQILAGALSVEAPFPEMKTLNIKIREDAVASMVKLFSSVFILRVTLQAQRNTAHRDPERRTVSSCALRPLSELKQVRLLQITVDGNMWIEPEDLVALGSLRNLMHLDLVGVKGTAQVVENFTDDHFHRLVSGLPDLETLTLHSINSDVTSASLVTLAKCCPRLESCLLAMYFNPLDLPNQMEPLFPNLCSIHVGCFWDPEIRELDPEVDNLQELIEKRAHEHVARLETHFPRASIESYGFPSFPHDPEFSQAIMGILQPPCDSEDDS